MHEKSLISPVFNEHFLDPVSHAEIPDGFASKMHRYIYLQMSTLSSARHHRNAVVTLCGSFAYIRH